MTALRIVLVVILLMMLAVVGLAVRLAAGPVPVGIFTDRAQSTLAHNLPGWQFTLKSPRLHWKAREGRLELVADDVEAVADGGAVITISEFRAELGLVHLLSGDLSLKEIDIQGGRLDIFWSARELANRAQQFLVRDRPDTSESVTFDFDARTAARDAAAAFISLRRTLDPDGHGPRLRLRDAGLTLTEIDTGTVWVLSGGLVEAFAGDGGTVIAASGSLAHEQFTAPVSLRFWRHGRNEAAVVEFYLAGLNPSDWTGAIPAFSFLHGIDLSITADLSATLNPDGELGASAVHFDAGAGRLDIPAIFDAPRYLDSVSVGMGYDAAAEEIAINTFSAEFADTRIDADGIIRLPLEAPEIRLQARMAEMRIQTLKDYWPRDIADGGRRWVNENVEDGFIGPAELAFRVESDHWTLERLPDDDLDLRFGFRNLSVHYLRPMPAISDGRGRGYLDANGMIIDVEGGTIDGLPVAGSKVVFDRLGYPTNHLAFVTLNIRGALPHLLAVIDQEPLGYISEFGLDPAAVNGDADVSAQIDFPLSKDLMLADIDFDIRGDIANLSSDDLFGSGGLQDGFLALDVSGEDLAAKGSAILAGIPVEVKWLEDFEPETGSYSTRLTLSGRINEAEIGKVAPGFIGLTGDLPFSVLITGYGPDARKATSTFDLTPLGIEAPKLNWKKAQGVPGSGHADLTLDQSGIRTANIMLESQNLEMKGTFELGNGQVVRAGLGNVIVGQNRFSADYTRQENVISVEIDAEALDLRGVLDGLFAPSGEVQPDLDQSAGPDLRLTGKADHIHMMEDVVYSELTFEANRHGGIWDSVNIVATDDDDHKSSVVIEASGEMRQVRMETGDSGRLAKGLGIFSNAVGGDLTITAILEGTGSALFMEGEARMTDLTVVRDSALPTAIEAQSPAEQFNDLVGEDGLEFRRMALPFRLQNGVIDIDKAYANGPRLGLTLEGQVDRGFNQVHVNGVIVPAYGLNALLGKIPLVGTLLTGGEGQGMFALTYRIEGSTDDPNVEINPLSALAPGILRRLIEGSKGSLPDKPANSSAGQSIGDAPLPADTDGGAR